MWVHDLRDADANCGGKAVGLARLMSAGLDVPPGFVIDGRAFTSIVGELKSIFFPAAPPGLPSLK